VRAPRWVWWAVLVVAAFLIVWGWYVLGYLTEPSAVGRLRAGLIVVGVGSIIVGVAGAVTGVAYLVVLYSRRK
jgi:hypothetical protein